MTCQNLQNIMYNSFSPPKRMFIKPSSGCLGITFFLLLFLLWSLWRRKNSDFSSNGQLSNFSHVMNFEPPLNLKFCFLFVKRMWILHESMQSYFLVNLWYSQSGSCPKEDLAKVDYKWDLKVKIIEQTLIFLAIYWNQI